MKNIKLLDLYCGAGGSAKGYFDAGFSITGVDKQEQKNYPYDFHQGDALAFLKEHGHRFDVIHASPPCQKFSSITRTAGTVDNHVDLIKPTREMLLYLNKPYIIENVPGAKDELIDPIMLCGTMFDLQVLRHRYFELGRFSIDVPFKCNHLKPVVKHGRRPDLSKEYHGISGHFSGVKEAKIAMEIDWMVRDELSQAIPPAYTYFIGSSLLNRLD